MPSELDAECGGNGGHQALDCGELETGNGGLWSREPRSLLIVLNIEEMLVAPPDRILPCKQV